MGTPWGEVRYASGIMPTDYTYTGQYSNVPDFGLMFYNARWYDPYLSRFTQADTIIPLQTQGVQAWDRVAYVNNNPLKYTDPSGNWLETAFDIVSLGLTINDIRNEGFTVINTISLVTDVAAIVIPAVPAGASHVLRATKYVTKTDNGISTIRHFGNVLDAVGGVDNVIAGAQNGFAFVGDKRNIDKIMRSIDALNDNPLFKDFYYLLADGTSDSILAAGKKLEPEDVAKWLASQADYTPGTPVCHGLRCWKKCRWLCPKIC